MFGENTPNPNQYVKINSKSIALQSNPAHKAYLRPLSLLTTPISANTSLSKNQSPSPLDTHKKLINSTEINRPHYLIPANPLNFLRQTENGERKKNNPAMYL